MSLYLHSFIESLLSTLWPPNEELTAQAMQLFGGYDMAQAAIASASGAVTAAMLLWLAGMALRHALRHQATIETAASHSETTSFFSRGIGLAALALIWLPMGFMIALAAGFLRVPLWRLIALSALGCAAFYGSQFNLLAA